MGTPPAPPDQPPTPASGRGSRMLGNRAVLVSAASTIVFFVVIGVVIALAPGSDIVAERFLDWEHLKDSFTGTDTSPGVGEAFLLNIRMFVIAEVFILIIGLLIAIVRGIPGPVFFPFRAVAVIYTDLFRGIPLILVLYMIGFGVPGLGLEFISSRSEITYGIVALVLVYSAYVAEVYRAGIDSVHSSQTAAARSLGLSRWKALRFVVLPQAVRRVIPPLLNDFIGLQKDTALVSVLGNNRGGPGRPDLWGRAVQLRELRRRGGSLRRSDDSASAIHGPPHRPRPAQARSRSPRMTGTPFLRLEDVHKSFGDNYVLKGIDLTVDRHEVICLIGASGSGKSTILKCINLLEPVDAGRIVLDGSEITGDGVKVNSIRQRIGIVFQAFNLFPHMTVLRNITLGPREALGLGKEEAGSRATELLARFGLSDKRDEYPDRLSGGQQQRVAIVRALAMRPDVILLDEVTSALDPELVGEVLSLIRELAEGGMTMLIATHEMGFARDIANQVCFLDDGRLLEQGSPQQIFEKPKNPRTQQFLRRIIDAGRL